MTATTLTSPLSRRLSVWRDLSPPEFVVSWLREGSDIPWTSHHRPRPAVIRQRELTSEQTAFVDAEIARLLHSSAIEEVQHPPRVVCPLGVVPKKNGKLRLIHDLRPVNNFVSPPKFKLEGLDTASAYLTPGCWTASIDLKDGYWHVPVRPRDRTYLGLRWRHRWYRWTVLPFGLSSAPWTFTKTVHPVVEQLRSEGVRVVVYLDDFLIVGRTRTECQQSLDRTLALLDSLGWRVNREKSQLTPSQATEWLGHVVRTSERPVLEVPRAKIKDLRHQIHRILGPASVPCRQLARVAGGLVAVTRAILPSKLMLREVYRIINETPTWSTRVTLTPQARQDLSWWLTGLQTWNGRAVVPPAAALTLLTDASDSGWGGILKPSGATAHGEWPAEYQALSINVRELLAVECSLMALLPHVQGRAVLVRSDNVTTVAYLNHWGGRWSHINAYARRLHCFALQHRIELSALHIAGRDNNEADELSRRYEGDDWGMTRAAFARLDRRLGPHDRDLFASGASALLPSYVTRHEDAFSMSWSSGSSWICPPWRLLRQVVRKIRDDRATATVVAPVWRGQPWFRELTSMLTSPPVPLTATDFRPAPTGRCEPWRNSRWQIAAFPVSGSCISPRDTAAQ